VLAGYLPEGDHFFVAVAERRDVLFRYTPTNDGEAVKTVFAGFEGNVHR
jgi:hypothetical protein